MAHITKIKAGKNSEKSEVSSDVAEAKVVKTVKAGKTDDKANRDKIKAEKKRIKDKEKAEKKANRKPMPRWLAILTAPIRFIFKPFAALGCYIHESWIEIRQVHWPNRKQTWKMLGAILIYTIVFLVLITILDILFTFIFNKLLG